MIQISAEAPPPPLPAVKSCFVVGFNSVNRFLEKHARNLSPHRKRDLFEDSLLVSVSSNASTLHQDNSGVRFDRSIDHAELPGERFATIFVPRYDQSSILHSHLPLLIHVASLAKHEQETPRLVTLPRSAEARLSSALRIPRVGIVGLITETPNTMALIDLVAANVAPLEIPWLDHELTGHYLPVQVQRTRITTADPSTPL